ncbi:MAG: Uma2 family endonuclease [Acidobacteriota bacterium]
MATIIEKPVESKIEPTARSFTVDEYYRMAEAGIIQPGERVELIEGRILKMSPKGTAHSASTTLAARYFIIHLGDRAIVRIQEPVHIDDRSEPEPDVVLARPLENKYSDHHPAPGEILLILEIADTSARYDREVKSLLFAQAGVIQYCILNLNSKELEDYRDPGSEGYRSKQTYKADEQFSLVAFPEILIAVRDLLPPE